MKFGEFEGAVLVTVMRLDGAAYGAEIRRALNVRAGREYVVGAVYTALQRLEDKALLSSSMSTPTPVRGGRARRHYQITAAGRAALHRAEDLHERLWAGLRVGLNRT